MSPAHLPLFLALRFLLLVGDLCHCILSRTLELHIPLTLSKHKVAWKDLLVSALSKHPTGQPFPKCIYPLEHSQQGRFSGPCPELLSQSPCGVRSSWPCVTVQWLCKPPQHWEPSIGCVGTLVRPHLSIQLCLCLLSLTCNVFGTSSDLPLWLLLFQVFSGSWKIHE